MNPFRLLIPFLLMTSATGLSAPGKAAATVKTITVDYTAVTGRIDLVLGLARNPHRWLNGPAAVVDLTEQFRAVGARRLRTGAISGQHSHPTALEGIFPDWKRDATVATNYVFDHAEVLSPYQYEHSTDYAIADIVNNGFETFFQVGFSGPDDPWGHWRLFRDRGYAFPDCPFPDTAAEHEKITAIAETIVKRYNQGWRNGHRYGIRYWEFWNEPDTAGMWDPTPDGALAGAFHRLYARAAPRLKAADPGIRIGTPALAWTAYVLEDKYRISRRYCEDLIQYCREQALPLDFYAWHHYGGGADYAGNSWRYFECARRIRQALDENGFSQAESVCSEWNPVGNISPFHNTPVCGAAVAVSLMYLQYAGVDAAYFFPESGAWGLFDDWGRFTLEAHAHQAFHWLQRDTPVRLAAPVEIKLGDEADNYAAMAGRSESGDRLQVLMADEDQRLILDDPQGGWWKNTRPDPARRHYNGFVLHIRNLPPDRTVRVTYRCMDQNHGWRTVEGGTWRTTRQQRDIQLVRTTSGPSVCLAQVDLP